MFECIAKKFLGVAVVCGCFAGQFASAQASMQRDRPVAGDFGVAAMVDGHAISTDEVDRIAMQRYGPEVLDHLIDNYLIEREAERLHVEVSEAEIDNQVRTLAEAIKPKTLAEGLQEHRQTLAELRDDFRYRLLALKLAALSAPPGHFVHAHAIFIEDDSGGSAHPVHADALAEAAAIQKQLLAGAGFEELARQYPQNSTGRTHAQDLGILFAGSPGDPAVIQAALALKAGAIANQPVKTRSGYCLILVSSTDAEHPADENPLYSNAKKRYEYDWGNRNLPEYMRELRSRAVIRQFLDPTDEPSAARP